MVTLKERKKKRKEKWWKYPLWFLAISDANLCLFKLLKCTDERRLMLHRTFKFKICQRIFWYITGNQGIGSSGGIVGMGNCCFGKGSTASLLTVAPSRSQDQWGAPVPPHLSEDTQDCWGDLFFHLKVKLWMPFYCLVWFILKHYMWQHQCNWRDGNEENKVKESTNLPTYLCYSKHF